MALHGFNVCLSIGMGISILYMKVASKPRCEAFKACECNLYVHGALAVVRKEHLHIFCSDEAVPPAVYPCTEPCSKHLQSGPGHAGFCLAAGTDSSGPACNDGHLAYQGMTLHDFL